VATNTYPGIQTEKPRRKEELIQYLDDNLRNDNLVEDLAVYLHETAIAGDYKLEEALHIIPNSDIFEYDPNIHSRTKKENNPISDDELEDVTWEEYRQEIFPMILNEERRLEHHLQIPDEEINMRKKVTRALRRAINKETVSYSPTLDESTGIMSGNHDFAEAAWENFHENNSYDESLMKHYIKCWTSNSGKEDARSNLASRESFQAYKQYSRNLLRETFGNIQLPVIRGADLETIHDLNPDLDLNKENGWIRFNNLIDQQISENGIKIERSSIDSWATKDVSFYTQNSTYGRGVIMRELADIEDIFLPSITVPWMEDGEIILDTNENNQTMQLRNQGENFRLAENPEIHTAEEDMKWIWRKLENQV
jgi:hypothetical protein